MHLLLVSTSLPSSRGEREGEGERGVVATATGSIIYELAVRLLLVHYWRTVSGGLRRRVVRERKRDARLKVPVMLLNIP